MNLLEKLSKASLEKVRLKIAFFFAINFAAVLWFMLLSDNANKYSVVAVAIVFFILMVGFSTEEKYEDNSDVV